MIRGLESGKLGGVSMDVAAADYSGDESITVLDALMILRHTLNV